MATFRHSNSYIWINGINFLLRDFIIDEPLYGLPSGGIERSYKDGLEMILTGGGLIVGNNETELEGYISKLNIYIAAREARRLNWLGRLFADTLAVAKARKKKQQKRVAIKLFRAFEDTDLELTDIQLQDYKTSLIAQKPAVAGEIDALNSIGAVAEYFYNNWPTP